MKTTKEDKLFSLVIRESNDWTCELCGKVSPPGVDNGMMDCSHDRSRRHPITRLDPRNCVCSCRSCHMKSTEDHDFHIEAFRRIKTQEVRDIMRERSLSGDKLTKHDKEAIHKHYKQELGRIKALRMNGKQGKIEVEVPEVLL